MEVPLQYTLLNDLLEHSKHQYHPSDSNQHWALIDPVTLLNYLPRDIQPTYSYHSHFQQKWSCEVRVFDRSFGSRVMVFDNKKMAKKYSAGLVIEHIMGWKREQVDDELVSILRSLQVNPHDSMKPQINSPVCFSLTPRQVSTRNLASGHSAKLAGRDKKLEADKQQFLIVEALKSMKLADTDVDRNDMAPSLETDESL